MYNIFCTPYLHNFSVENMMKQSARMRGAFAAVWLITAALFSGCQTSDAVSSQAETFSVSDEAFTLTATDAYSDGHYFSWTVEAERKDGEPISGECRSKLTEPDIHVAGEVAFRPGETVEKDGKRVQSFAVYTSPVTDHVTVFYDWVDGEETALSLTVQPKKAETKTGEADGITVQLSEKSLLILIPEEQAPSNHQVSYTISGKEDAALYEGTGTGNPVRLTLSGEKNVFLVVHGFFDESFALEKAESVMVGETSVTLKKG